MCRQHSVYNKLNDNIIIQKWQQYDFENNNSNNGKDSNDNSDRDDQYK